VGIAIRMLEALFDGGSANVSERFLLLLLALQIQTGL
jgi:hypothetical protein